MMTWSDDTPEWDGTMTLDQHLQERGAANAEARKNDPTHRPAPYTFAQAERDRVNIFRCRVERVSHRERHRRAQGRGEGR